MVDSKTVFFSPERKGPPKQVIIIPKPANILLLFSPWQPLSPVKEWLPRHLVRSCIWFTHPYLCYAEHHIERWRTHVSELSLFTWRNFHFQLLVSKLWEVKRWTDMHGNLPLVVWSPPYMWPVAEILLLPMKTWGCHGPFHGPHEAFSWQSKFTGLIPVWRF